MPRATRSSARNGGTPALNVNAAVTANGVQGNSPDSNGTVQGNSSVLKPKNKVVATKKKAASNASNKKKKEPEPKSPEKIMKSITVKGKAPVDDLCPKANQCHVFYEDNGCVWDCMLNQTNIQNNNNKYYLIQLLKLDGRNEYYVWMRWGRVGFKGQSDLSFHGNDLERAKAVFTKKFLDKTKNHWEERSSFQKVGGKYDLVLMDYNTDEVDKKVDDNKVDDVEKAKKKHSPPPESKLEKSVQELIKLICDVNTMEETVIEMQFDTKKSPLGKITTGQIKAGYEALKRVSELINTNNRSELMEACNDFYTRIPHEFGMKTPPIIRTNQEVKNKISLLEALGDIQIAMKMLNNLKDKDLNPVDSQYKQLDVDLKVMDKCSKDFQTLERYIQSTHASTHSQYKMEVLDIFECNKELDNQRFQDKGNKLLLFHGSRMSNWAGILSQGLKIAPPEAPVTGYMFGKGVYFADMASKSANYCWTTPSKNTGLLMMCEVSLGSLNELVNADYNANELPKGKHSVKGLGRIAPDEKKRVKLSNGCLVPMGPGVTTNVKNSKGYTLNYNEYIVYDTAQIKMRYFAQIKFNYGK